VTLALTVFDVPGRETEAWQLIDRAERLKFRGGDRTYLHMAAGVIAHARGDIDEASARYRLVIEGNDEGHRDDAVLRLAGLLVESKRGSNEATTLLRSLIASGAKQAGDAQRLLEDIDSPGSGKAGS
jgi:hypothetical protein